MATVNAQIRLILLVAGALCSFSTLADDIFRCGSSIIRVGLSSQEVAKKCGQPDSKETRSEPILARNASGGTREIGQTSVEIWQYSRGAGKFPAVLTIEEGKIKKIELIKD